MTMQRNLPGGSLSNLLSRLSVKIRTGKTEPTMRLKRSKNPTPARRMIGTVQPQHGLREGGSRELLARDREQ